MGGKPLESTAYARNLTRFVGVPERTKQRTTGHESCTSRRDARHRERGARILDRATRITYPELRNTGHGTRSISHGVQATSPALFYSVPAHLDDDHLDDDHLDDGLKKTGHVARFNVRRYAAIEY